MVYIIGGKRWFSEFLFLCIKAGFKTFGEVVAYMQKEGITERQLFYELDALLFPEFIDEPFVGGEVGE